MTPLITLGLLIVIVLLLILLQRSGQAGRNVAVRPLPALDGMHSQLGRAIESGSPLHITLGHADLTSQASPTSIAAIQVLDHLAEDGCANGAPPLVTVNEGTLLLAGQDSLRHAYQEIGRHGRYDPAQVQFLATETDPFVYAGGVAGLLRTDEVTGNMAVGRFGMELGLIAEAANNQQIDQILGTDDPTALAIATAFSANVLVGEEMLVAGYYVDESPNRLASLQLQDIIRWVLAGAVIGLALVGLL